MLGHKYVINCKQFQRQILIKTFLESEMDAKKVQETGSEARLSFLSVSDCLSVYIDILYV